MSSLYVRTQILDLLTSELPSENVLDLTAEYASVAQMLTQNNLNQNSPWLGVQFVPSSEVPVDIAANNNQGCYRETGVTYLHIVDVTKRNVHTDIIVRGEAVMSTFRGRRLGEIVIEEITPTAFGDTATLNFEGGYSSGAVIVYWTRHFTI